jgi:hypothetical protein
MQAYTFLKHSFILALFILSGCSELLKPLIDGPNSSQPKPIPNTLTYLVYGQSNAVSNPRNHATVVGNDVHVQDLTGDPQDSGSIETNSSSNSVCWFIAGNVLHQSTGKSIHFINVAVGGTDSYQMANAYFNRVQQVIKNNYIDAILYVQGEADSQDNIPQSQTYSNLKSMIQKTGRIPWYIALDSFGTQGPRLAELQVINEGLAMQGPDLDAIRTIAGDTADNGIHLSGGGLDLFGDEWAAILEK